MTGIAFDRCFSAGAYTALDMICRAAERHPELAPPNIVELLLKTDADSTGLDFSAALHLKAVAGVEHSWRETRTSVQEISFLLLEIHKPWWLRLAPSGRERLKPVLTPNELQCLRRAGLYDPNPDAAVVSWWDRLAALTRGLVEVERMEQARSAERLSLERERARLLSLGLAVEPELVALEDNSLGYDIRSYDIQDGAIVSRLIEVKSTLADSFHISRNEWRNAVSAATQYVFHIWKMPDEELCELPVTAVRPHVPHDLGNGRWQDTLVSLTGI